LQAQLAGQLAQLESVYRMIDEIGVYVHRVDKAVGAMEGAVAESARQYNKLAVKKSLGSVAGWFSGGAAGAASEMDPFVRPTDSVIDTTEAMRQMREKTTGPLQDKKGEAVQNDSNNNNSNNK
jgi:hypothetical protein